MTHTFSQNQTDTMPHTPEQIAETEKRFTAWKGEKWCGHPSLSHSYEKTMHWKVNSKGIGFIEFRAEYGGGLNIDASESPESGRGGKRVMLDLSPEKAKELRDLLLMLHPLSQDSKTLMPRSLDEIPLQDGFRLIAQLRDGTQLRAVIVKSETHAIHNVCREEDRSIISLRTIDGWHPLEN